MISATGSVSTVNTTTIGEQFAPEVIHLADGRMVIVYASLTNKADELGELRGRFLSSSGTPEGSEFLVATGANFVTMQPDLAALSSGGFSVSWSTGFSWTQQIVHAQAFDSLGNIAGQEFSTILNPRSGSFVVRPDGSIMSATITQQSHQVEVGVSNGGGNVVQNIIVDSNNLTTSSFADVHAFSDGSFAVTWLEGSSDLHARIFGANGSSATSEIVVGLAATDIVTNYPNSKFPAAMTMLADGKIAVAWEAPSSGQSYESDVRLQIFNADGSEFSSETTAFRFFNNNGVNNPLQDMEITPFSDGRLAIVTDTGFSWWRLYELGTRPPGILIFNQDGSLSSDQLTDFVSPSFSAQADIALLPNNQFALAWANLTLEPDSASLHNSGIQVQTFGIQKDQPPLSSASEFYADHGNSRILALATLSLAAYALAVDESGSSKNSLNPIANTYNDIANAEFSGLFDQQNGINAKLHLLTSVDIPSLALRPIDLLLAGEHFAIGELNYALDFPLTGLENGVYHNGAGAALLARSSDTLFVTFRGTNDASDLIYDQRDWLARSGHFALFAEMIAGITEYLKKNPEISSVEIAGHSLGGAMAQKMMEWVDTVDFKSLTGLNSSQVHLTTFANPGSSLGFDYSGLDALNVYQDVDAINLPTYLSSVGGLKLYIDSGVGFSPLLAHSMNLYLTALKQLNAAGLNDDQIKQFATGDYTFHLGIKENGVTTFGVQLFAADTNKLTFYGTDSKDVIIGNDISNSLHGEGGTDVFLGGKGDDAFFGDSAADNSGVDQAWYLGLRAEYNLERRGDVVSVAGPDGKDTLYNVEQVRFADSIVETGAIVETPMLVVQPSLSSGQQLVVGSVFLDDTLSVTVTTPQTGAGIPTGTLSVQQNANNQLVITWSETQSTVLAEGFEELVINATSSFNTIIGPLNGTSLLQNTVRYNGSSGVDILNASNTEHHLIANGGNGNDRLIGGSWHDNLSGGKGNDKILGNAGNDVISGNLGSDSLTGGSGADTFVFDYVRADKGTWDQKENDIVLDFRNDQDTIQIHADFGLSVTKLIRQAVTKGDDIVLKVAEDHTITIVNFAQHGLSKYSLLDDISLVN